MFIIVLRKYCDMNSDEHDEEAEVWTFVVFNSPIIVSGFTC